MAFCRDRWVDDNLQTQVIEKHHLRTDSTGRASLVLKPGREGEYYIAAEADDRLGNCITSLAYLWVYGGPLERWESYPMDDLKIVTDKRTYKPGDTARVPHKH